MPKVCVFSSAPYVKIALAPLVEKFPSSFHVDATCSVTTAPLCGDADVVCFFVNDDGSRPVLEVLAKHGVKLIAMRCAGYDRIDLAAAQELGLRVARVPAYSPYAVAEHAVGLAMCLNRHLHRCYNRVREGNFTLNGLIGIDFYGKTVGIIGTGKIGQIAAGIFAGLGMRVLGYDKFQNDAFKQVGTYVELDEIMQQSEVISLHVPLLPSTRHMIDKALIAKMKRGVIFVNCSRGGLVNTQDLIDALQAGQIGAAGLDVYENEGGLFFKDMSSLQDDDRMQHWDMQFATLRGFPNVIVTPHSAFLTQEALQNICATTILNIEQLATGQELTNEVKA
jgi:D-lactate dehydrogenase